MPNVSPCHCKAGNCPPSTPSTGSPAAAAATATGSSPTSGAAPVWTGAPRLAASSWAPRQTPKKGTPARTAAAIQRFSPASQGCSASSCTLIGPPMASTRSASRQSGSSPPSSSSIVSIATPRSLSMPEKSPGGSHRMCCRTSARVMCARAAASADDQHRPVSQVDHLVRGAAEDGPGEVAPAAGAHDDDVGVVLLGVREDLTRRVPEAGRPYVSFGVNARLPQCVDPVPDRLGRLLIGLARHIPHLGDDLLLQEVQHPHLALGQQGQLLGRVNQAGGDLRMVHGDQQSVVHQSASFARGWPPSWATPVPLR